MTAVLLVTGGGRGIGAAIVRLAARRGMAVGVNFRSNAAWAHETVRQIRDEGGRAVALQGDMAREDDVNRVFSALETAFGGVTRLACCAGVTGPLGRLEQTEGDTLRAVFAVNALAPLYAVRAAIPRMSIRHGGPGGAIVLVSSIAATTGSPGECVGYAASKGSVDTMVVGLGQELAADGIRINAVSPGLIDTDIHPPGRVERMARFIPMQRAGLAQEVAEGVLFLLSDAASYVTGANLRIAGGR